MGDLKLFRQYLPILVGGLMVFAYQNCAPLESSHEKSSQGSTSSPNDDADDNDVAGTNPAPAPGPTPAPVPTPNPMPNPTPTPPPVENLCPALTTPTLSNPSALIFTVYNGYGDIDQGSSDSEPLKFDFSDSAANQQHDCGTPTTVSNNGSRGNEKIGDLDCTADSELRKLSMEIGPGDNCKSGSVTIAARIQATCSLAENRGKYVSSATEVVVNVVNTCMAEAFVQSPNRAREAGMGSDVAIGGNTFVTAANRDSQWGTLWTGTAEVFSRSGTNLTHQQTLVPTDVPFEGNENRLAGGEMAAIAITRGGANEFIVSGAPLSGNGAGAVYIWKHNGSSWALSARILPPGSAGLGNFGKAVAIDGNRLIVGAPFSPNDGSGTSRRGNAYVYTYDGSQWNLQNTLASPNSSDDEYFGYSVALKGSSAVVGAPLSDDARSNGKGRAYYFPNGSTSATIVQITDNNIMKNGAGFGHAVDFDGTRILVGAPWAKGPANNQNPMGQAFYFNISDLSKPKELALSTNDDDGEMRFGWDVAIDGNKVLVGAPYDSSQNGSTFHYDISIGNYPSSTTKYFQLDGRGTDDQFGKAVAVEGNFGFIGSPLDNVGGGLNAVDAGSARLFELITVAYP